MKEEPKTCSIEIQDLANFRDWPMLSVYGASAFLDMPVAPMQWLVPGLIPLGVPTVLASKGGLGKSYLSLQLCICLATGKPFMDFQAQKPMGAIYLSVEDGKDLLHGRFEKIVNFYKESLDWSSEDEANLRKHFAATFINWQAKNASAFLPELMPNLEFIFRINQENHVKPGIIVIDTLARVSEGDENTVAALRPVLNACNRIAEAGWTPFVLHHVAKGQDGARGQNKYSLADRMSTEWVRGSSAIVDNFRAVLQFAAIREDEAEPAGLDQDRAHAGQYLVFGPTKLNGGQRAEWRFLEQDEHGRWFLPGNASETLAKLKGKRAVEEMSKRTLLLIDIHKAVSTGNELDRVETAKKYCSTAKDQQRALRLMIDKLRKDGFIQKGNLNLTLNGLKRFQETQARNAMEEM